MIHEFCDPIPVTTPLGGGYLFYVRDGGNWENDIFAVILSNGGKVMYFRSDQIRVHANSTFDIKKDEEWQKTTLNSQTPNYLH